MSQVNLFSRSILFPFLIIASLFTMPAALAQVFPDADEISDLQYMREEEKLARDLYTTFYDLWKNDIFSNIAASEQRHMDAVLSLLNLYGIADPAAGQPAGQFSDSGLQSLYDDLLAQGSASLPGALEAAILVEETDIADLETAIAQTDLAAIQRVYRNLLKGSENHLAAFTNRLLQLDSSATGGGSFGPGEGVSVYEPYSQTLYIPAIDVTSKSGTVRVYDTYLRVVESIPFTLELLTVSLTDKLPNSIHASFSIADGILTIPKLVIGTRKLDSLDGTVYSATFHVIIEAGLIVFVLDELVP